MPNTSYAHVRLESPHFDTDHLDVHVLDGRESISNPFHFDLEVVVKGEPLDLDIISGANVRIVFERGEEVVRKVHGVVSAVETLYDTEDAATTYRIEVVPRMFRMSLVETLDIFIDKSVPEIIEAKLALVDLGAIGIDYELRLMHTYPRREFTVQYKETDLAFISRLMEHLGISYFFKHEDGQDRVIFTDDPNGFEEVPGDSFVPYHGRGEEVGVHGWHTKRKLIPRTYVCRDYNYRTPSVELQAEHVLDGGDAGGIIEYGGHVKDNTEAAHLAMVRSQERLATQVVHTGRSTEQRFGAGYQFNLGGHAAEGGMLIVEIHHHHSQATTTGGATGGEKTYRNELKAIDGALTYRPPRTTPIPRIYGVITGLVETESQGSVGKHAKIDEEGRYLVRFLFDTAAPGERKASRPVRRIQPTAGPHYGMHFPLRPGIEVLITFIDGDPDRPLIVGAVPNPVTPTPVHASEATKNRIRTESGVLFEIEDGAGS